MQKQNNRNKKLATHKFTHFKDWRIKTKIIAGFFFVAFIYGIANYFSINYIVNQITDLNKSTHIIHQIIIKQKEIDLEVRTYLLSSDLATSPKIDFTAEEKIVNDELTRYKILASDDSEIITTAKEKSLTFLSIASETIKLHNQNLKNLEEIAGLLAKEKDKRYAIKELIFAYDDPNLREKYAIVMYYSKEALYQYKDQSHIQEWHDSIHLIQQEIALSDAEAELIDDIDDYELYIQDLGVLVLDVENKKTEERNKIEELKNAENEIAAIQNKINGIVTERQEYITNLTNFLIFIFILIILFLVIGIGYLISNTISKPIKKLAEGAIEIGNGNYKKRISISADNEIGQTAQTINEMLDKLEEERDVLEIKVQARTKKLKIFTDGLESEIEGRTKELKEKIDELERFNDLAIGRELKMLEFKEQIKRLKQNNCSDITDEKASENLNCWDFWKCKPKVRNNCPAYKNNSGRECWKVSAEKCPRSKERGLEDCKDCSWYKKMNFEKDNDITLNSAC